MLDPPPGGIASGEAASQAKHGGGGPRHRCSSRARVGSPPLTGPRRDPLPRLRGGGKLCPTSHARNASGSATVAERPMVLSCGAKRPQPRQSERQEVAALVGDQPMELVKDHRVEIGEETPGIGGRKQQRNLLGRGQEDVGRRQLLALALVERGVAGAGFQSRPEGPSRRRVARGCARCRRRAPSGAKYRGYGCRHQRVARSSAAHAGRPGSAGIRQASFPPRSAQSGASIVRRAPSPGARSGGRAATSLARRTSRGRARAEARSSWSKAERSRADRKTVDCSGQALFAPVHRRRPGA